MFGYRGNRRVGGLDAYTQLLLNDRGADLSTDIYDKSQNSLALVLTNNTRIGTDEKVWGQSSLEFTPTADTIYFPSGGGAYVYPPANTPFCIDGWVRLNDATATQILLDYRPISTQGSYITWYWLGGKLIYYVSTAARITSTTTFVSNTWYHVAITRDWSNVNRMFINGVQEGGDWTYGTALSYGTNRPIIGSNSHTPSSYFKGWIQEFRISIGDYRWDSDFNPPIGGYN